MDVWLPINDLKSLGAKIGLKDSLPEYENYLSQQPKYSSGHFAFVPVGNGCDNFCSYCVVPYARGREVYRSPSEIIAETRKLIDSGYKEITLIAQNVNSYKRDGVDFPGLLKEVAELNGDFWLRFATSHPKDMSDELINAIAQNSKICEHIHLPAQSGDDEVLRRMNRKYTRGHYLELLGRIRKEIPEVSLTTDIIVGYPGESHEQFLNTVELFEKARFDMAYIAQYSPRPGTASFKLKDDVPQDVKKKREEELMRVLRRTALENNRSYLGLEIGALIEGQVRGVWRAKTRTGKSIRLGGDNDLEKGVFKKVKITKAEDFGFEGKIV